MTLPELQHLLNLMDADNKKIRDAYRLGIDLTEFTESAQEVVNTLLKHVFDEHQYETLSWWMYEKDFGRRVDLQMWDADGSEVCRTVEELHQFLFA
jgi:trans-2-enoyl-CoA reductase